MHQLATEHSSASSRRSRGATVLALEPRREPPHNDDAEKFLLSAMLKPGVGTTAVASAHEVGLTARDFYRPAHRLIYTAVIGLEEAGTPCDFVMVIERLRATGCLEDAGGSGYVSDLLTLVPTTAHAVHHARLVYERALKRRAIEVAERILDQAYDPSIDAFALVEDAQGAVLDLNDAGGASQMQALRRLAMASADVYQERYEQARAGVIPGVPSGIVALDTKLGGGFKPCKLYIVAARPGMGKSGLALTIARNAALAGKPVGFFALEMAAQELFDRMVSSVSGINSLGLAAGTLSESDWDAAFKALIGLADVPIVIDDSSSHTLATIRARARRMVHEHKVELIVIDYLQLMNGGDRGQKEESREREISRISRGLKLLSKELGIPIIALSQLNRAVESRHDKRPMLSDLRESGALEQDSDVVLFVYRDEEYGIMMDAEGRPTEGVAELIVGKHRGGPTGTVRAAWIKERTLFENLYPGW